MTSTVVCGMLRTHMLYLFLYPVLFLVWWRVLSAHWYDRSTVVDRMLGAFLLTVFQLIGTMLLLGAFDWIYYWPIFLLNLFIIALSLLFSFLGCRGGSLRKDFGTLWDGVVELWQGSALTTSTVIIAVFCIAVVIYYALRMPAQAYDGWGYHMTRAILINQEHHMPPFHPGWLWTVNNYPANVDVLFALALSGTGNDAWCATVQIPLGLAGCLAVYRLCRILGASRESAVIGAACLFSIPLVLHQMWVIMVDLGAAAFVWIGYAMACCRGRIDWVRVALCGLAVGLAIGSKMSVAYWCVGVGVILFVGLMRDD